MTKLTLRTLRAPNVLGGRPYLALCDENGPLPRQRAVAVVQRVHDVTHVTVEFLIDGDQVRIEAPPAPDVEAAT